MVDINKTETFIDDYLQHAEYDPIKAREYYLRTRKLKGRKAGKPVDPRSNLDYKGNPLPKLGTRMDEDTTPDVSPTGAKLTIYDGGGLGRATYADGSVYDGASGWKQAGSAAKPKNPDAKRRVGEARKKLEQAKKLANKKKDPKVRASLLKQLASTEQKLKAAEGRL